MDKVPAAGDAALVAGPAAPAASAPAAIDAPASPRGAAAELELPAVLRSRWGAQDYPCSNSMGWRAGPVTYRMPFALVWAVVAGAAATLPQAYLLVRGRGARAAAELC